MPGLHPGLREWLRVRKESRELQEKKGKGKVTTALAVQQKYKEYWQNEVLKGADDNKDKPVSSIEDRNISAERFELMLETQWSVLDPDDVANCFMKYRGTKLIKIAANYGFSLNYKYRASGKSLLHQAVERSDDEKILFLLERGVSVNGRDNKGNTPLHLALQPISPFHPVTIAEDLIDAGADIEAKDVKGRTPLHLACALRSKAYVDLLLTSKAEIIVEDNDKMLPYDHCLGKEEFRRWYDQKCFWSVPREIYQEHSARLLARQVVVDVFK